MGKVVSQEKRRIQPEMTVLDVVYLSRRTEVVFKEYDKQLGLCLCCQALFDPLRVIAEKYGLDLERLLEDLEAVLNSPED